MARTRVKSTFAKKLAAMRGMTKAFKKMPELMAMDLLAEIKFQELAGNKDSPVIDPLKPIKWQTGQLVGSMDIKQLDSETWALSQNRAQAPYAPRVMVFVAKARVGKPVLTLLKERRFPVYEKAIKKEFLKMVKMANQGKVYKLNKKTFING